MHLILRGSNQSIRVSWQSYAALRDNVQHYLEGGLPGDEFSALHGLEAVVDQGSGGVDAGRLRDEVVRAWYAVRTLAPSDGAVSLRSRIIMTGCPIPPPSRGTVVASMVGWELPMSPVASGSVGNGLQRAMWEFVSAVLNVTDTASSGSRVRLMREGPGPRYAAGATPSH